MARLNHRAYEILRSEIRQCCHQNLAGNVQQEIALKRLEKLRLQDGPPASFEELRETFNDILPNLSEQSLKAAAAANGSAKNGLSQALGCFSLLVGLGAATAGLIWVANLPFPMIRHPVAKTAPLLLLPSFMSMDYNYRQAISLVEQADQLVNKATGPADVKLGLEKVTQAQKHLDKLPVWFLGYYPQRYCTLFGCNWKFTYDEFESARKNIGRMEAKIFQEDNAINQLTQAETALNEAKQQYQTAPPGAGQQKAIASWQTALDLMQQIPQTTLAGQLVQPKLVAAQRDFQEVVGDTAGRQQTNKLIEAAKTYAMAAAQSSQNPPHSATEWGEIISLWEQAIAQLRLVTVQDEGYVDAQAKLAEYQKNRGVALTRQQAERESVEALKQAKNLIPEWQQLAGQIDEENVGMVAGKLQTIINQLESVKYGTTTYAEAQNLLKMAREGQKRFQGSE
jgi:hypothetical protein